MVETIKRARRAKNKSLAQVAKKAGLLGPAVARAERKGVDPRVSTVLAIAGALDVPVCELLGQPCKPRRARPTRRVKRKEVER